MLALLFDPGVRSGEEPGFDDPHHDRPRRGPHYTPGLQPGGRRRAAAQWGRDHQQVCLHGLPQW